MQKFKTLRTKLDHLEEAQLLEKLSAADPTGKWVSDFVHSDNPKFAGKSKKERIKMALGASYAAKRAEGKIKEEVELNEEMSHSELADHHANLAKKYYKKSAQYENQGNSIDGDHFAEVAYHHADAADAHREAAKTGNPEHSEEAHAASKKANSYDVSESVKLDELSKTTLASYAKKATRDARMKYATGKDFERHARTSRKPEYKAGAKEWEDKYKSDARRREAGVNKAIDRLAKEEVELDEARYSKNKQDTYTRPNMRDNYADFAHLGMNSDVPVSKREFKKKELEFELRKEPKKVKEEVEQIDEISAEVSKRVAQARDRSAANYKLTPTQSRRLGMGDKGGEPDLNAAAALKSAMKRGAKNVYGEEVEIEEGITKDTGWKPMPKERKDEYGNPIKTQNVPKRLAKQSIPKKPMKEETEDKPGIHKVSVTINDKDKDDRDFKVEKMLKVKASNQAAALKIAKSHYGNKGYKVHNASYHGIHEEGKLSSGAKDPCWKGYEMVGTKKKNGKEVPNCVPKK